MNTEFTDLKLRKALVQKAVRYIKTEGVSLEEAVEIFLIQTIRHEGRPLSGDGATCRDAQGRIRGTRR